MDFSLFNLNKRKQKENEKYSPNERHNSFQSKFYFPNANALNNYRRNKFRYLV